MRLAATLAIVAAAAAGCGGKKRQKRTGDAAPVEVITEPNLSGGSAAGGATESDEKEPNDEPDTATALAPGSTVRGRIEPDTDVDHYRIEVAQAGALVVSVTAVEGVDLSLEILDPSGAVVARSDRGGARTVEGVPNLGVTPGRYVAVVRKKPAPKKPVKAAKGKGKGKQAVAAAEEAQPVAPAGSAPVYHITAQLAAPATGFEREPDDDRGTANDLLAGDTASGYIGWTGDVDVWKLSVETLSDKNELTIELGAVENVAFTLEIADGVGQTLLTRKVPKQTPLVVRSLVPVVPAGAPPFHYLTIKADRSNPESPYQLKVTAGLPKGTDPEVEPNDTIEHPMAIPADRTVVNAVWSPGDVDCFAIPVDPNPRTIEVSIGTPESADLDAELLVDGKVIATSAQKGKGIPEKVTGAVPAGAQAVVRVRGAERSAEGEYEVSVHEGPATAAGSASAP
ncbi:MAG: hypothetical protein ACTHU0_34945 [Kofleriaceae bacterium]